MQIEQNWSETKLQDYLLYGYWEPYFAFCVLSGIDGKAEQKLGVCGMSLLDFIGMDGTKDDEKFSRDITFIKTKSINRLRDFWHSDGEDNTLYPPSFFIDWALSKKFKPEWLDWAIQNELYIPKDKIDKSFFPWSDKSNPCYAPELDLALRAWQAISSSNEKGKPKARILKWLTQNHPELSNQAMERISIVANWHKEGGASPAN